MKDLRSEVRQEITSMASEIKESQLALIEDMMGDLQEAMSAGYRQIAYEISINAAERRFKEQFCECPPGENRDGCIEHFVNDHLRKSIDSLDNAPQVMRGDVLKTILDRDETEGRQDKGTVCERCRDIYAVERDKLLEMGEKFAAYRKSLYVRRRQPYFKQLPDDVTLSEIIEPLSHRARFAMLKNLTSGRMSFKEFGDVTGYNGGHLVYHLNKLVSSGLVLKEDGGLYCITDKGMGVMEIIRKMYG